MPDSRMHTSISLLSCPVWKCLASSQLSGLCLMSDRCFPNLLARDFPVCPTYKRSCFLQRATYITFSVRQFPPSFSFMVMFFLELLIEGLFRMSLQRMQDPHGDVDVGFVVGGLISFRMRKFRIVFGRRKATDGCSLNILLKRSSACRTGKCCFRIDGILLSDGCQSHTKMVCGSFFLFLFSTRIKIK